MAHFRLYQGSMVKDDEEFSESYRQNTLNENGKFWRQYSVDILCYSGSDENSVPEWLDEAPGECH